ncbi:MAG TPA: DUF4388 domain-containing protein, partial [Pyrinomonadaceae bacterium]|nr:DUF4388 domain-containing protein [Pyrinomonadaceae bacterium]
MALTGHLSDLSLSELIEFFCNQRKSGRLKVLYPQGPGYFYLQAGSVVDARIGVLHGIDAVYYALTLPNAEFEFSADAAAENRTINQPWTQVVLEGLRRLDENISPGVAFPPDYVPEPDDLPSTPTVMSEEKGETERSFPPAFLAFGKESGRSRKPFFIGAAAVAVLASVAVIGVPAGWYKSSPATTAAAESTNNAPTPQSTQTAETPATQAQPTETASTASPTEDPAAEALRRQREKERRAREAAKAAETATATTPAPETTKP